jgi:oxygen-independent coproporphyrinogen-3 oxidase
LGNKRWWNHSFLDEYIGDIGAGKLPWGSSEILTKEQLHLEAFFLGLRTKRGIHLRNYSSRYGYDLISEKADTLARLVKAGFIEISEGYLQPTRAGLAVADSLVSILAFE